MQQVSRHTLPRAMRESCVELYRMRNVGELEIILIHVIVNFAHISMNAADTIRRKSKMKVEEYLRFHTDVGDLVEFTDGGWRISSLFNGKKVLQ